MLGEHHRAGDEVEFGSTVAVFGLGAVGLSVIQVQLMISHKILKGLKIVIVMESQWVIDNPTVI